MLVLPESYSRMQSRRACGTGFQTWMSSEIIDPLWDNFLRRSPYGHYQQSSLWGDFKSTDGWHQHRIVLTDSNGIAGGFQILWKKRRGLRVGYVSKGPVVDSQDPVVRAELNHKLRQSADELGLHAVVVQSPDDATAETELLEEKFGFIRSNPMKVIESTYLVDVREGIDVVRKRMHRNVRQCVRKSREHGVIVRTGTEEDLPLFFDLMCATCRRQGSSPNPATLGSLRRLWHLFAPGGSVEMALAGRDGQFVAGRMNLIFGHRVTQWKKGWDGSHPEWHPNELLADHALEWAQSNGHHLCDFSAISRVTAERILAGRPNDSAVARSRDMFNLRLGGYPKLLPRAHIYLPNPVLRWGYRNTYSRLELHRERRRVAS